MTFNSTPIGKTSSPSVIGRMVEENTESGGIKDINVVNQRKICKKKKKKNPSVSAGQKPQVIVTL